MNKRIRKKIAKRQIAEATQQLVEAFGRYYEQKRRKEELTQSPM